MMYFDVAASLFGYDFCRLFGAIHRAVLSARAAEVHLQVGETPLLIASHGVQHHLGGVLDKFLHIGLLLQEFYHRLVLAGVALVLRVASGVGQRPAVEHETATVTCFVVGQPAFVRKTVHCNGEWGAVGRSHNVFQLLALQQHGAVREFH